MKAGAPSAPPRRICAALLALCLLVVLPDAARAAPGEARGTAIPPLVTVAAGPFIAGSDREERERAYRIDEAAYGHSATRDGRWYEAEPWRHTVDLPAFQIMRTSVTNAHYAAFVAATDHPPPDVDAATWESYGLIHPYERTRRHAWSERRPPRGREAHPVVLVSHDDALAYAAWLGTVTGRRWRLPSALEWEKAARGTDGRAFPWGEDWDPTRLNSHDAGSFDTLPVGTFPEGASVFGLLDPAGQVYEWTATAAQEGRFIVKGGSWDDSGCGVCRPAARHARPAALKHILIGFRLVAE